jgi:type I restriction enzyme R subunit
VQTLSRLNRCHKGKTDTFVVDFVNEPNEILEAFKTYYETAELAGTTDPDLVFDLKAKLDAAGHYDDFEVERVVKVELDPDGKQSELAKALEPVADRLLKKFKSAQNALSVGKELEDAAAIKEAEDELNALTLFKGDMGAFLRLYTFLSQIFDYGNTAVEKRSIFYKRLLPLLEFGRERETVDLSKVVLTHYHLKNLGKRTLPPGEGEAPKLQPMTEAGTGQVQDKQKALLDEIIAKVNDLFEGELTDGDKLSYVHVIKEKLLESELLQQQAVSNTKEQFGNSPDLASEQSNAVIDSLDAHTTMSTQILNQPDAQAGLMKVLLDYLGLYEALRERAATSRKA